LTISWLVTAEHASNRVPERWRPLFAGHEDVLESHRGWDPGSLVMAQALAAGLGAPLLQGRVSRLLIDLNRSANHPGRFSAFSRNLPPADKAELIKRYWQPHWSDYRSRLDTLPGRIIHLACHSFTPILDGKTRATDIGLLYDPSRPSETRFCRALGEQIRLAFPDFRVHMNQPYRGVSNGLGQQHRRQYPDDRLISFELEINQRLLDRVPEMSAGVLDALRSTATALA
jgi:predicted N-formylglutamate amidohydrolase